MAEHRTRAHHSIRTMILDERDTELIPRRAEDPDPILESEEDVQEPPQVAGGILDCHDLRELRDRRQKLRRQLTASSRAPNGAGHASC